MLLLAGCAPTRMEPVKAVPEGAFQVGPVVGARYSTPHYLIHTTVKDRAVIDRLGRVLEAVYAESAKLVPGVPQSERLLRVYLLADYSEWESITRARTGDQAGTYLAVNGYTLGDELILRMKQEPDTLMTAAHEGFHQFVGRHFQNRLPPTLEEGLAATYEDLSISEATVRINTQQNHRRREHLGKAIEGKYLLPLDLLIQLHAGDFSGRDQALIEGYYAQAWALARMVRDQPQYRVAFLQLMKDTASGNQALDVGRNDGSHNYEPGKVKAQLQRYLAPDWAAFEADYAAHILELSASKSFGE